MPNGIEQTSQGRQITELINSDRILTELIRTLIKLQLLNEESIKLPCIFDLIIPPTITPMLEKKSPAIGEKLETLNTSITQLLEGNTPARIIAFLNTHTSMDKT